MPADPPVTQPMKFELGDQSQGCASDGTSGIGTNRTSSDVRYLVATGVKADMAVARVTSEIDPKRHQPHLILQQRTRFQPYPSFGVSRYDVLI
jgi:hypothetical protein